MQDTTGGDTTGIWYQNITPGTGHNRHAGLSRSGILCIYLKSHLTDKYILTDTVLDHFRDLWGISRLRALRLAMHNILKYKGGKMRVLIPSHLAYGVSGAGSGSSTVANGRIAGNQCLDYTINMLPDQAAYDDVVIQTYMAANNLTVIPKSQRYGSGMYYKITTAPTGTNAININSTVTLTYTGYLIEQYVFDNTFATLQQYNLTDITGVYCRIKEWDCSFE